MKRNQKTQRREKSHNKETVESPDLLKGRLLDDKVLVRPITFLQNGGLATPQQYEDKPEYGKVIMVGKGRLLDNGTLVKPEIKEGDVIFFEKYSSKKVRNNGVDYLIIRLDDIDWVNNK